MANENITAERLKELLQQYEKNMTPVKQSCPNCGYCPHCGQSARPYWPVYPAPYVAPYRGPWYEPHITWTVAGTPTLGTTSTEYKARS